MVIQCEIDVVGVRIQDGVIGDLYLIDSAFHENGLNYGDVVARVLKKILRAVFVSDTIFKSIPAKILFVSPKCGEELRGTLVKTFKRSKQRSVVFIPMWKQSSYSTKTLQKPSIGRFWKKWIVSVTITIFLYVISSFAIRLKNLKATSRTNPFLPPIP